MLFSDSADKMRRRRNDCAVVWTLQPVGRGLASPGNLEGFGSLQSQVMKRSLVGLIWPEMLSEFSQKP
jgi:hypothetical protein